LWCCLRDVCALERVLALKSQAKALVQALRGVTVGRRSAARFIIVISNYVTSLKLPFAFDSRRAFEYIVLQARVT
jgi:uncharacterized membrane protein